MISTFIDENKVAAFMRKECKEQMIAACEPVVQEAMKQIERKLREKVGSIVISMLDTNFNVFRDGRDIRITVRQQKVD